MQNAIMGTDTERFDIARSGVTAPGHFAYGAGQIAAASLIPVASGFFGTADNEIDIRRMNSGAIEQVGKRQKCRGLGDQIFHEHIGLQTSVFFLMFFKKSDQDIIMVKRQRTVLGYFFTNFFYMFATA